MLLHINDCFSMMYKLVRIYVATENETHMLLCCLGLNKRANMTENEEKYINLVPMCPQNELI